MTAAAVPVNKAAEVRQFFECISFVLFILLMGSVTNHVRPLSHCTSTHGTGEDLSSEPACLIDLGAKRELALCNPFRGLNSGLQHNGQRVSHESYLLALTEMLSSD